MSKTTATAAYRRTGSDHPVLPARAFCEYMAASAWLKKAMRADPLAELGCITEHMKGNPRITILAKEDILKDPGQAE